jgi:putative FmdB family regulatory protein
MPIFEYKCPQCGYINEVLVKSAESKPPACPECGYKKTEKQFSNFAAVVKENRATPPNHCQTCLNSSQCSNFKS